MHIIYIQCEKNMPFDSTFEFILSQTDHRPMYQQIMEQIKTKVTIGDWNQGYKLPSIREMAVAAKVSVITVKRAYQELEIEGVIVTQQGKGSFIALVDDLSSKLKEQEINRYLNKAITIARTIGMNEKNLQSKLRDLQELNKPLNNEKNDD